jgi:hypothetical protein
MPDRISAATLWPWAKLIIQLIGAVLALLGGSQAADIAPAAFAGDGEAAGTNSLVGMALMFLTPAVGWVVKAIYGKTRGKQFTPVADLISAEQSIVTLELHLAGRPTDLAALAELRKSVAVVFSTASKATVAKPVLTVDVK